jgi:hypothetical protein
LAISDKNPVDFDGGLWKTALQLFCKKPVCRRPTAVEQARLAQNERTGANRREAARVGERALQKGD